MPPQSPTIRAAKFAFGVATAVAVAGITYFWAFSDSGTENKDDSAPQPQSPKLQMRTLHDIQYEKVPASRQPTRPVSPRRESLYSDDYAPIEVEASPTSNGDEATPASRPASSKPAKPTSSQPDSASASTGLYSLPPNISSQDFMDADERVYLFVDALPRNETIIAPQGKIMEIENENEAVSPASSISEKKRDSKMDMSSPPVSHKTYTPSASAMMWSDESDISLHILNLANSYTALPPQKSQTDTQSVKTVVEKKRDSKVDVSSPSPSSKTFVPSAEAIMWSDESDIDLHIFNLENSSSLNWQQAAQAYSQTYKSGAASASPSVAKLPAPSSPAPLKKDVNKSVTHSPAPVKKEVKPASSPLPVKKETSAPTAPSNGSSPSSPKPAAASNSRSPKSSPPNRKKNKNKRKK